MSGERVETLLARAGGKEKGNKRRWAALRLAKLGYRVLPIREGGKIPQTAHGLKDATRDPKVIRGWWAKWPKANLALATNGLFVIDIDPGGEQWLKELTGEQAKDLAAAPQVTTPRGGSHFYFAQNGVPLRNSAGVVAAGVDVRADGGYVLVAPSRVTGRRYRGGPKVPPAELPTVPDWLVKLATTRRKRAGRDAVRQNAERNGGAELLAQGGRNCGLTSLGGRLRRAGADEDEIRGELLKANRRRCVPLLEEREVEGVAASVARYPGGGALSDGFRGDDAGNARRFAALHSPNVRYCGALGGWLLWDGTRWARDEEGRVVELAKQVQLAVLEEAKRDERSRGELLKVAQRLGARAGLENMLALARSIPGIAARGGEFDRDPWALNTPSGTVDLRTGELRPHRREDLLTCCTAVLFEPQGKARKWRRLVAGGMGGDQELAAFLQRAVGYSATGVIREHVVFLACGPTGTSKSTVLGIVQDVLGSHYAATMAPDLLLAARNDRHPTELFDLRGKRFVVGMETGEARALNEARMKMLAGGDTIKARQMHADFVEFAPTFKLWLGSNFHPRASAEDDAVWRRLREIPFTVQVPPEKQDPRLRERLVREEGPGVLRWIIEGALAWQREGLGNARAVAKATERYRGDMDTLGAFLAEECFNERRDARCGAGDLVERYNEWAKRSGERELPAKALKPLLERRGFTQKRTGKGCVWLGLGLAGACGERPRRRGV